MSDDDAAAPDRYGSVDVTPDGFERLVASLFRSLGSRVTDLKIKHHDAIRTADGEYVFDATARFEALGVQFLVLIEAKLLARPVERSVVQTLHQKLSSTGAQKAIVASSSGFQRGAIEFASEHGIALVRIVDGAMRWSTRSTNAPPTRPGASGLASMWVEMTDEGGERFTTLNHRPDSVAEMLGIPTD